MVAADALPARGRFLVLEGIDGCGKSTQLELLRQWLPASGLLPAGRRLLISREPGGTALGQALRQLLLHPPEASEPCPTAELLLYAADRAQHVQERIAPALAAGDWVLCDRFTGSTAAYQGYGRGLSLELIAALEAIATGGLNADLTLWLDLPLELSLQRRGHRPADRIEAGGWLSSGAFSKDSPPLPPSATGGASMPARRPLLWPGRSARPLGLSSMAELFADLFDDLIGQAQAISLLQIGRLRPVDSRLIHLLHWIGARFGMISSQGTVVSLQEMNLTHRMLADLTGMTRVSVTKALSRFKASGLIVTRRDVDLLLPHGIHGHPWHL